MTTKGPAHKAYRGFTFASAIQSTNYNSSQISSNHANFLENEDSVVTQPVSTIDEPLLQEPHDILGSSKNKVQKLASMELKNNSVFKQLKSRHWRINKINSEAQKH